MTKRSREELLEEITALGTEMFTIGKEREQYLAQADARFQAAKKRHAELTEQKRQEDLLVERLRQKEKLETLLTDQAVWDNFYRKYRAKDLLYGFLVHYCESEYEKCLLNEYFHLSEQELRFVIHCCAGKDGAGLQPWFDTKDEDMLDRFSMEVKGHAARFDLEVQFSTACRALSDIQNLAKVGVSTAGDEYSCAIYLRRTMCMDYGCVRRFLGKLKEKEQDD